MAAAKLYLSVMWLSYTDSVVFEIRDKSYIFYSGTFINAEYTAHVIAYNN